MKLTLDKSRTIKYYTNEHGTTGITELQVCKSAAGYYIGRMCDDGPYSRDSQGYYPTRDQAERDLNTKIYVRR